jgi:hypothetical protein
VPPEFWATLRKSQELKITNIKDTHTEVVPHTMSKYVCYCHYRSWIMPVTHCLIWKHAVIRSQYKIQVHFYSDWQMK